MYTGPHLIKDNLVFGYDTGYGVADNNTGTRFYLGRPTINYGPTSLGDWGTENTAQRIATNNTYLDQPTYNCRTTVGASHQGIDKTISGLRTAAGSSGTVTMSCYIKNNNNTSYPCYAYMGHDFSSTRTIAANSDWQRIQWTVNQSSMNNDYVELRPYTNNANKYLEMTMPQVEVNKGAATPWVDGTRSVSGSLVDLEKTSDIKLSNVSFGATGQPTFDGTSDYIDIGSSAVLDVGTMTQEAIYQPLGINRRNPIIADNNPTGSDYAHAMWLEHYNDNKLLSIFGDGSTHGDVSSTATITDTTKYHHIVCVRDAGAKTIEYFINGVSDGVKDWANKSTIGIPVVYDGSTNPLSYDHYIGGHGFFSKSYANIPVVKIYNRKLTLAEVKQNYNAYKIRFGI